MRLTKLVFFLALTLEVRADLLLAGNQEYYLFAEPVVRVPLRFDNTGAEEQTVLVNYRIYQGRSSIRAPLGAEQHLPGRRFPGGAQTTLEISFTPPEIESITPIFLELALNNNKVGFATITLCPTNLLETSFKNLGGVGVFEPEELLAPLLRGAANEHGKVLLVRLPDQASETRWSEEKRSAKHSLFIVSAGVAGSEKLMPMKITADGRGAILQEWFIPNLRTNVLSQLRLLRAAELLQHPELTRSPALPVISE